MKERQINGSPEIFDKVCKAGQKGESATATVKRSSVKTSLDDEVCDNLPRNSICSKSDLIEPPMYVYYKL